MDFTNQYLQGFVGGQIGQTNEANRTATRGEILKIGIADQKLRVELRWNAKKGRVWAWEVDPMRHIVIKYHLINNRTETDEDGVSFTIDFTSDKVTLYRKGSSDLLDPADVKGLSLPT